MLTSADAIYTPCHTPQALPGPLWPTGTRGRGMWVNVSPGKLPFGTARGQRPLNALFNWTARAEHPDSAISAREVWNGIRGATEKLKSASRVGSERKQVFKNKSPPR